MTKRWASLTPDNFRFTAKFTRSITHEKRLAVPESEKELHYFFDVMRPLRTKLLALLLQLPPSLTAKEGMKKLEALTYILNPDFRYAVEVRHKSWFDRTVYKMLSDNNICLAWSQLDAIQTPAELTSDFLYLRFISGAIVYRFYESYGIYIQNLYADTEISLNLDEVRALEITNLLSISEEELKDKSIKLKPVIYDKLEKCKNIINSGYAGRTKANQIARVQFSSEENGEEYREASIKESLPRDSFTDSGHVYPDLSWSTMGSSIADKETKPLLSYIQENIPLDSGDSSDLLTKVENRIRTLRENGHHPDTMFLSLERKSQLRQIAHGLFRNGQNKMEIDGEEIFVILSPKGFAVNEVFIFSSEAFEVTYASKEPSNPLSIAFYNTEPGNDEVIVECRIRMRARIRDSEAFTRFI